MDKNILDVLTYSLVRIDETQETTFKQMIDRGFTMVNIDVDADKMPYALFVRNDIAKKQVVEYFITYSSVSDKGGVMHNKILVDEHPVRFIARMRVEFPDKRYSLIFFRELYETMAGVASLRF